MSPWLIYVFGQVDNVREVLGMLSLFGVIGCGVAHVVGYIEGQDVPRWIRGVLVGSVLAGLVALALPSSRTIALMYVLPRVAESEAIQHDVPELYRPAVDVLKSELSDGIGGDE